MFFIMGIDQKMKDLGTISELMICRQCGRYGRYQVYMTYMCLSLFFLPVLKWAKRYYARTVCCGTVYELPKEIGRRIARGEDLTLSEDMLTLVSAGNGGSEWHPTKRCGECGYETNEDFEYCPKCGKRF